MYLILYILCALVVCFSNLLLVKLTFLCRCKPQYNIQYLYNELKIKKGSNEVVKVNGIRTEIVKKIETHGFSFEFISALFFPTVC